MSPRTYQDVTKEAGAVNSPRFMRRSSLLIALASLALLLSSAPASAAPAAPAPWWHLTQRLVPSRIEPEGEATIVVQAINLGNAPSSGKYTFTDKLPPGLELQEVEFFAPNPESESSRPNFGPGSEFSGLELCQAGASEVTCTSESHAFEFEYLNPVLPYDFLEMRLKVKAKSIASSGEPNELLAGGGGAPAARIIRPVAVGTEAVGFGVEEFEFTPEEEGGGTAARAGSHPYQLTNTLTFNRSSTETLQPPALPRNLRFALPAGQLGNPLAAATCSSLQFSTYLEGGQANACPPGSAIGATDVTVSDAPGHEFTVIVPVFNLQPTFGEPARFGFSVLQDPVILDTSLRSGKGEDYGVDVDVSNITQVAGFLAATTTFWGAPNAPSHSESRGWGCIGGGSYAGPGIECSPTSQAFPTAFLTLPTNCGAGFEPLLTGTSWPTKAAPAGFSFGPFGFPLQDEAGDRLGIGACNQLPFAPTIKSAPTTTTPSAPSGLNFDLEFENPGLESSEGLAESQVKKAVVALPAGITTNPAVANGLSACSQAAYEAESLAGEAGCPQSSKIGEVEIDSPLVEPTIDGSIYVARQHDNPAGNLLSIYMVAKNPELGVLVRSSGAVTPDPQTGQLTTTFGIESEPLPQLPFSHFHLHFREGPRAPLIAPGLCGTYSTQADLYPWSNPAAPVHREASFSVAQPCPASDAAKPNHPSLDAGTTSPIAGAYSPLVFSVEREDGSQTLSSISATLPEGLLGKLAGLTECSKAAIAQAESRSGEGQGALELASPSCPASSQVGVVDVGTGVGTQPYYVQGKAYLAGPYKGAPLSLAIITPAVVGPFDLGTIVVRTALYVDETTAQITAKSDPIPTIVHGLPTVVQSIALNMNRPNFTLNPTSCEPKQITGQAISTLGAVAPLEQRFQVGACNALGFKPSLKLSLKGGTKRHTFPSLKAVLTYPKGSYANIAKAQVTLPHSAFLEQGHIGTVCTQPQLKSQTCPKKSIYGRAKAWSPLLDKPLEGPVYLGVGYGHKLPDLVADLNGQIRVLLNGKVDTGREDGLRNTFLTVPDAPVSRFELNLFGGKRGLVVNSENLCGPKAKVRALAHFVAQNGKELDVEPVVQNSCGKKKAKRGDHKRRAQR